MTSVPSLGMPFFVMIPTSHSLLDRLRTQEDAAAWERLVAVYRPWIVSWITSHGVADSDADDLAQEVLLVVLRELPHFQHNRRAGAFRAWLRNITVHRLRDFVRSRRYQPEPGGDSAFLDRLNQLEDPGSQLSRQWDDEHDRHVVRRLLALVQGEFQESTWRAFRAVMLEGAAPAEAAARLGMSVNAVLLAKSRILARLRQECQGLVDLE
jgi:RNA polymerase sigma-70 factor (ECF subfamily)